MPGTVTSMDQSRISAVLVLLLSQGQGCLFQDGRERRLVLSGLPLSCPSPRTTLRPSERQPSGAVMEPLCPEKCKQDVV